jgi:integral membrane protein
METVYRRYRVMSYVTGTTLLMLCATFVLHKVSPTTWQHLSVLVRVIGIGHGVVLYPIYMITCFYVVLKARLNLLLLAGMFLAGFVPGLAFYLEYRMRRRLFPTNGAS